MGHGFAGFAGFIALIVVLAMAGGRLLGIRLPVRRALLVSFAGLVAGYLFAFLLTRRHPGQLSPLVVIAAVVAAMLLTVLAELAARPGARPAGRVCRGRGTPCARWGSVPAATASWPALPAGTGWPGSSARARPSRARQASSRAGSGWRWRKAARSSSSSARSCPPAPTCCQRR